jgi:hypothetical protein
MTRCIQTEMNTNTFQSGLGCNLDIGTTHANKSHLKEKIVWQGEYIENSVIVVPVSFKLGLSTYLQLVNK